MNKTGTRVLETERLVLRRFVIEDAEAMFYGWCNDPDVTKFLTWPPHESVEVTRYVLNEWIPQYKNGDYFNWAMILKESGKLIGNISVVSLREITDEALIGYCLSRECWGNGYMPEALKAVADYLFDFVGINRLMATHDVNNPKSGRVMQKAGMKYEGTLRQAGHNMQGVCDASVYSIIRSDREKNEEQVSEE